MIEPQVTDGHVYCECGRSMRPTHFRDFIGRGVWIFWRCVGTPDHVTCAVPVPAQGNGMLVLP